MIVDQLAAQTGLTPAFDQLIDYAGLFPPAGLSMRDALRADTRARAGSYAWIVHAFVVPASRLSELATELGHAPPPVLSVILDGDLAADLASLEAFPALPIGALEVRLPAERGPREAALALLADWSSRDESVRPIWCETGFAELATLADARIASRALGAKLRCGGQTAAAFPSVEALADAVAACVDAGIPFKATAGLHHPVRHVEAATGFPMHGFLNLLVATALARRSTTDGAMREALADEDPANFGIGGATLRWRDRRFSPLDVASMRRESFVGYGSCSVDEPIADLRALGLVA